MHFSRCPGCAWFWPGDEEFPSRASILFDPADIHYLPIDGLALMGSGLAGRLLKAGSSKAA